jgi:ferredoxin
MACVGACPGKALQHGQGVPELGFIEANCLQCGICTRTCPENAIWITPRLLFDRAARGKKRLLAEDVPFNCTVCGKPFATRSVISNMLTKLQGHWMFQGERARNRLTMCEDCRVVDAMEDPDSMLTGIDGQIHQ